MSNGEKTTQPSAQPPMNVRNAKNVPVKPNGERDWSHDICGFSEDCSTCILAWYCPCMVYSKNLSRLERLEKRSEVHPDGGDMFGGSCCLYVLLNQCGLGFILGMGLRGDVRGRYQISGNAGTDCLTAAFCQPCQLTQVSREIELEENALQGKY